jgi:serine/threonine protein kinase
MPNPAAPELSGRTISSRKTGNSYTIGELIGEGRFAWIYSCRDLWENELAVKILKPSEHLQAISEHAAAEFQTLLTVRHPFITYVYDVFEFDRLPCIAMERCRGPISTLFKVPGFRGDLRLKSIARCLLQAVHFLHMNGFVHKDIHCGNVFLNREADDITPAGRQMLECKLGDLGTANLSKDVVMSKQRLPPECLDPRRFGPLDRRIDIYHCGLVFLQILKGEELVFTPEQIVSGAPREMALQLPLPYSAVLEKALRRAVQYRTATAREFWQELNAA